jgi:hypothetical protein
MLCCFPYFLSWLLTTLATNHQILYVARYFTFLCTEFFVWNSQHEFLRQTFHIFSFL